MLVKGENLRVELVGRERRRCRRVPGEVDCFANVLDFANLLLFRDTRWLLLQPQKA